MILIAFAHLTVTESQELHLETHKQNIAQSYKKVPNPVPKQKIMAMNSDYHDLLLIHGNFDLEINKYEKTFDNPKSNINWKLLNDYVENCEIRSASFSADFFLKLSRIFGELENISNESMTFRTLNMFKSITLRYDKDYPVFQERIDLPGLSALAFYVSSLDEDWAVNEICEKTEKFTIRLRNNIFMIRFVKCGEVWVELLQRAQ